MKLNYCIIRTYIVKGKPSWKPSLVKTIVIKTRKIIIIQSN